MKTGGLFGENSQKWRINMGLNMDKYFIYRPLLDLISRAEGTASPKRNYNETLGYGACTGGAVGSFK